MSEVNRCPSCAIAMKKNINPHAEDIYPAEQFWYFQCDNCGYRLQHPDDCKCNSCKEHRQFNKQS